ncbi:hypothetical protein N9S30_00390 [bacterium]|nr:hypothetical protein [bacterium]
MLPNLSLLTSTTGAGRLDDDLLADDYLSQENFKSVVENRSFAVTAKSTPTHISVPVLSSSDSLVHAVPFNSATLGQTLSSVQTDINLASLRPPSTAGRLGSWERCGSFNCTRAVSLSYFPALGALLDILSPAYAGTGSVLLRYPSVSYDVIDLFNPQTMPDQAAMLNAKIDVDYASRTDEVIETCIMASLGLGPDVLAVIPMDFLVDGYGNSNKFKGHMYVFEDGWESMSSWFGSSLFADRAGRRSIVELFGQQLTMMVKKLSENGFALLDTKPKNMIVKGGKDQPLQIRFIDFGKDFSARFPNPSPGLVKCLTMVNGILTLSSALGKNMSFNPVLGAFYKSLAYLLLDLRQSADMKAAELCSTLFSHSVTDDRPWNIMDARRPVIIERKEGIELERSVAELFFERMQHYGRFVETSKYPQLRTYKSQSGAKFMDAIIDYVLRMSFANEGQDPLKVG